MSNDSSQSLGLIALFTPNPGEHLELPATATAHPAVWRTDRRTAAVGPYYGAPIGAAVKRFFKKYTAFTGRASRSEYWWVALALGVIGFVLQLLTGILGAAGSTVSANGTAVPGPGAVVGLILIFAFYPPYSFRPFRCWSVVCTMATSAAGSPCSASFRSLADLQFWFSLSCRPTRPASASTSPALSSNPRTT